MDTETKDPLVAAMEALVDGRSDEEMTEVATGSTRGRKRSRVLLGLVFMGAGVNHFLMPKAYERIVPPSMKGRAKDIVAVWRSSRAAWASCCLGRVAPRGSVWSLCWPRCFQRTCTWPGRLSTSPRSLVGPCMDGCPCNL
jgi:hypothetical protein